MPPKKRKAAVKKEDSPKKQQKQDGQKAISHDVNVPLDEGFHGDEKAKVYIDDDGIIFDASLNQTNIGGNNNKFYRLQLLHDEKGKHYYAHTRWGRVGECGQSKTMGPTSFEGALKEYEKKFKDKSGLKWEDRGEPAKKGKYTFIERSYEEDGDDDDDNDGATDTVKREEDDDNEGVESKLPRQTQRLVELIFNQTHLNSVLESIGYNANKLPLGKLSKNTLKQGFEHLHELASLIQNRSLAQNKYQTSQYEAIEDFSNKYYSTIPHEFGRNRPPLIDNQDTLRKETAMLDTLTDMEVANTIMKTTTDKKSDADAINVLDKRFQELSLKEMTPLEHKSPEYKALADYLIKSAGSSHNVSYRLEDIFRIERMGEADRFAKSEFADLKEGDRRLLWHGSRTTNYGGILSQGLRIAPPEAPVNGYAFGKGIYMADISSKSANYCQPGMSGNTGLLLLCEAELGKPMYEIPTGNSGAQEECKKRRRISTLGVGRTAPQGWKDGGFIHDDLKGVKLVGEQLILVEHRRQELMKDLQPDVTKGIGDNKAANANGNLMYNEYIVYDVAQLRLKYLLRVGF